MAHKDLKETASVNISRSVIGVEAGKFLRNMPKNVVPVALMPVKAVKGFINLTEQQTSVSDLKSVIETSIQSGTEKALSNVLKKESKVVSSSMVSSMMDIIKKAQSPNGVFGSSLFKFDLTDLLNKTLGNPLVIGLFGKEFGEQIVKTGIVPGIEKILTKLGMGENVAQFLSKTLFAGFYVKDLNIGASKLLKTIDKLTTTYEKAKAGIEKTVEITKQSVDIATEKLINDKQTMKKLILASVTGIGYPIIELFSPVIDRVMDTISERVKNLVKNIFTKTTTAITKRVTEFLVKRSTSKTLSKIPGVRSLVQLLAAKQQSQEILGKGLGEIVGSLLRGDFAKIPKISEDIVNQFNNLVDSLEGAVNALSEFEKAVEKDSKEKRRKKKRTSRSESKENIKEHVDTTLQKTDKIKPSFKEKALSIFGIKPKSSKKQKTTESEKDKKEKEEKRNPLLKFLSKLLGPIAGLLGGIAGFFSGGIKATIKRLLSGIGKSLWGVTKFLSKGIWDAIKFLGNNLIWKPIKFLGEKLIWKPIKFLGEKLIWKPIKFLGEKLIWKPTKFLGGKIWKAALYVGGKIKEFMQPLIDKITSLARPVTSRILGLGKYMATTGVGEAGLGAVAGTVAVGAIGGWAIGKALYNNDWIRKHILDPTIGRVMKLFANISVNGLSVITDPIKKFFRSIGRFFSRLTRATKALLHGHFREAYKIISGQYDKGFEGTSAVYNENAGVVDIGSTFKDDKTLKALALRKAGLLSPEEKNAFLNTNLKLADKNLNRDITDVDSSGIGLFAFHTKDQLKSLLVNTYALLVSKDRTLARRAKRLLRKVKSGNYKYSEISSFFSDLSFKYPEIFSKAQLLTMEGGRLSILNELKKSGVDVSKLSGEDIMKIDQMYQMFGYNKTKQALISYAKSHNMSMVGFKKYANEIIQSGIIKINKKPPPKTPISKKFKQNIDEHIHGQNKKTGDGDGTGGGGDGKRGVGNITPINLYQQNTHISKQTETYKDPKDYGRKTKYR